MAAPSPSPAQSSASIILISDSNAVLLLQRVPTSSAYPSAWVFPGGNLSQGQDGAETRSLHGDSEAYRLAAIRELFEETGLLLVRRKCSSRIERIFMPDEKREKARSDVHNQHLDFRGWLRSQGLVPATELLVPFTRWVTPANLRRRFNTQMYLCFLPTTIRFSPETIFPYPTPDTGCEHVSVCFLPAVQILRKARAGELLIMTPQFYLLNLLSMFLGLGSGVEQERSDFMNFMRREEFGDAVMCANIHQTLGDGRIVLAFGGSGPEVAGVESSRKGDATRVVVMRPGAKDSREMELWHVNNTKYKL